MEQGTLFQKVRNLAVCGNTVEFDFSKPEFQKCFIEELGGEDKFKSDFPKLYDSFRQAIDRDRNYLRKSAKDESEGYGNLVDIFYGFYNMETKHLQGKAITSLMTDAESICHRLRVYQEDGELLFDIGRAELDTHHAILDVDQDAHAEDSKMHQNLIFHYFATWTDNSDGLHAAYYTAEDECKWSPQGYVESLEMTNPVHKNTPADGKIIVCYDRTPSTGEAVDYNYQEAWAGGKQKLFLDVGGNVALKREAGAFTGIVKRNCELKLDCQRGGARYNGTWDGKFTATGNGFTFSLDRDWGDVVPSARLPIKDPVDFSLKLAFSTEKAGKQTIYVASNSTITGVYPISQLLFLWGCIAPDTPVLMADGSVRPAEEIRIGDRVALEDGAGTVKEIYCGNEKKPSVCIETANGKRLCCTQEHPVMTKRGFVMAGELNGDDRVKDVAEGFVEIKMLYRVTQDKVLNFDIDPEKGKRAAIICDGIVTGDNRTQKDCMDQAEKQKTARQSVRADEEFLRLKAFFERKNNR